MTLDMVLPLVGRLVSYALKSAERFLSKAQRDAEGGSRLFQLADFRRFIMSSFPMAPLFRQSVGFDRFNDLFESALRNETGSSYPPYNIEKHGDDQYRIVVAAAGFEESDLDLQVERSVLTISGGRRESETENVTYLHQGIAQRAFKLSFRLADHIEVQGAALNSGLLNIDLVRVVPEEAKPKRIPINADQRPALEG
jgi:molecular chaperone IbpA